ncbi:30S ribosomal protein S17-like [Xenia sp. Carnegie-2017]|uniref:30S ribosomal protein S17-like n=1 Tax=Xenia sp. Carnegie-2017 TaxID=2897299 RepID=UPI001F037483|nr:30S ribosomal protein S17-like [Xenia sp. Carnegie-2017]
MAQFLGRVIGTKMDKTAKVLVTKLKLHPIVMKYYNHRKVYFAHDENNECRTGDMVLIKVCPKMSKHKRFRILEILEKAPLVIDSDSGKEYLQDNREDYRNVSNFKK